MSNIYKQAAILGLTFATSKGTLTVNDLYRIPLTSETRVSINGLYVEAQEALDAESTKGLVAKKSKNQDTLQLKLDILKDVFETRQSEAEERRRKEASSKAAVEKLAQLDSAIASAKAEELKSKSPEELEAMRQALITEANAH